MANSKKIILCISLFFYFRYAIADIGMNNVWQDDYNGSVNLSALGFLAIPAIFWICGNIPIVWTTAGIFGLFLTIGGLFRGGPALYLGLLLSSAAWYGYVKEKAEDKNAGYRKRSKANQQEAIPQQQSPKTDDAENLLKAAHTSTSHGNSSEDSRPTFKPMTSREGDALIAGLKSKKGYQDTQVLCECGKLNPISKGWRRTVYCEACGKVTRAK